MSGMAGYGFHSSGFAMHLQGCGAFRGDLEQVRFTAAAEQLGRQLTAALQNVVWID